MRNKRRTYRARGGIVFRVRDDADQLWDAAVNSRYYGEEVYERIGKDYEIRGVFISLGYT